MHHKFFYPRNIVAAGGNDHEPRPGDYTVDGGICFLTVAITEANYLFDSTARTAVGNADFVTVTVVRTSATSDFSHVVFDTQGDGGSGALVTTGVGTSTAKNVVWVCQQTVTLFLPASLFGTTDTTRTGRVRAGSTNSSICFAFCSWNPSSGI